MPRGRRCSGSPPLGADVGFYANTGRKSVHLGTSACSQEEISANYSGAELLIVPVIANTTAPRYDTCCTGGQKINDAITLRRYPWILMKGSKKMGSSVLA